VYGSLEGASYSLQVCCCALHLYTPPTHFFILFLFQAIPRDGCLSYVPIPHYKVRVLQLLLINLSLYSISASMLDRFEKDVGMIDSSLAGSLQALNILLAGFFAAIVTVA